MAGPGETGLYPDTQEPEEPFQVQGHSTPENHCIIGLRGILTSN